MKLPVPTIISFVAIIAMSSCGELESQQLNKRAIRTQALEEAYASSRKIAAANAAKVAEKQKTAAQTTTSALQTPAIQESQQPTTNGLEFVSPDITKSLPSQKDLAPGR